MHRVARASAEVAASAEIAVSAEMAASAEIGSSAEDQHALYIDSLCVVGRAMTIAEAFFQVSSEDRNRLIHAHVVNQSDKA